MPRGIYKRKSKRKTLSVDESMSRLRKIVNEGVDPATLPLPPKTVAELEERIRNQSDRIAMQNKELEVLRYDLESRKTHIERLERVIDRLTQYD